MPSFGNLFASLTLQSASFMSGIKAAQKEMRQTQKTFQKVGAKLANTGKVLSVALTAPLTAFAVSSFKTASDAAELDSAFAQTFGSMTGTMRKWAEETGDALGRSTQEMQEAANTFGIFFNTAVDQQKAAQMSQTFAQLAQDLGSFYNVDTETAIEKLRSGLTGEAEPLRDFGVFLSEAVVNAKALEMGLIGPSEKLTEQQKILARYAVIMESTKNAQGDVMRTSSGTANQMRRVQAAFEELQVTVGTKLLPVLTPLIEKLADALNWFTQLPKPVQNVALAAAAIGAALGPVLLGIGGIASAIGAALPVLGTLAAVITGTAIPAIGAFVVAMAPVLLPLAAVAAAILGVVYAIRHWDEISAIAKRVYEGVKTWIADHLVDILNGVLHPIETVKNAFFNLYDAVVGHSYIPDMVNGIGEHMARLDALMVQPARVAASKTAQAFQALQQRVSGILDRLFPEQAAFNQLKRDIDDLTAYAAKEGWSPAQLDEAVRRARHAYYDTLPKPEQGPFDVAPDIGATGKTIAEQAGDAAEAVTSKWAKAQAANDNLVKSFAEMARDVASSLQSLVSNIKSGDWLGALQSVLDIVGQVAGIIKGTGTPAVRTFSLDGARAMGGPVLPNSSYLVGEHGPEILRMGSRGGSIIANDQIGGPTRVEIVPSPYFDVRVDGRAATVARPIAMQTSVGVQSAVGRRRQRSLASG